jgi:hypothetical protein
MAARRRNRREERGRERRKERSILEKEEKKRMKKTWTCSCGCINPVSLPQSYLIILNFSRVGRVLLCEACLDPTPVPP